MPDAATLAATIGGSVIALAGIGATAWAAKQERTLRRDQAEREHEQERERAHDARVWEGRSRAYEEVLAFAHRNMLAVERTFPRGGQAWGEPPGMLPDETYTVLQARATMFATEETLRALEEFNDDVRTFFAIAGRIERNGEPVKEAAQQEIDSSRERVRTSLRSLERCAREDLTRLHVSRVSVE